MSTMERVFRTLAVVPALLACASVAQAGWFPLAQQAPELPEPSSVILLAVGAVGLFGYAARQRLRRKQH